MLTCNFCDDPQPGQIWWEGPHYETFNRPRAVKCTCGARIARGGPVLRFRRWKIPEHDVECKIYGYGEDDTGVPRAPRYLCAECGRLYEFLLGFGYAVNIDENMRALAREHAETLKATGQAGCL